LFFFGSLAYPRSSFLPHCSSSWTPSICSLPWKGGIAWLPLSFLKRNILAPSSGGTFSFFFPSPLSTLPSTFSGQIAPPRTSRRFFYCFISLFPPSGNVRGVNFVTPFSCRFDDIKSTGVLWRFPLSGGFLKQHVHLCPLPPGPPHPPLLPRCNDSSNFNRPGRLLHSFLPLSFLRRWAGLSHLSSPQVFSPLACLCVQAHPFLVFPSSNIKELSFSVSPLAFPTFPYFFLPTFPFLRSATTLLWRTVYRRTSGFFP